MRRKLSRTRRDIIHALLELLKTNGYEEITITQIAQEASVARRTFYLNYQNKEGVMKDYIELLFDEYGTSLQTANIRDSRHDTIAFFLFWKENRKFLLLLKKNDLLNLLMEEYEQMLEETTLFSIENVTEEDVGAEKMRYVRVVLAASLMGMLLEWVRSGFREEPEELADVMENMMYHRKQEKPDSEVR